jgi:hypothetical protein
MITGEARQHLVRVCGTLNKFDVNYIVVGGAAVNYYGYHRLSVVTYHPELKVDIQLSIPIFFLP